MGSFEELGGAWRNLEELGEIWRDLGSMEKLGGSWGSLGQPGENLGVTLYIRMRGVKNDITSEQKCNNTKGSVNIGSWQDLLELSCDPENATFNSI